MSYSLPILNELHELFPDLLYRPSRFQTSNDVLEYIIDQSIRRPYHEEMIRREREQHEQLQERITRIRESSANVQLPPQRAESQQRAVAELEREIYGAELHREPIAQEPDIISVSTSSLEQLLEFLIESGLSNASSRSYFSRLSISEHLERATTVRELIATYDGVCTICHEEMTSGQHVRQIHHCNHMFHQLCIDRWFVQRPTCPTCRYDIRT